MPSPTVQTPKSTGTVRIFGIDIELDTPSNVLDRISSWISQGGVPKRVMYANAHVLNQCQSEPRLAELLRSADMVYCDGYGVRLAARALRLAPPHRMTGADWIWDLAKMCEARDHSLYLLGSDPAVAASAAKALTKQYPKLKIVGTHHGYFEPDHPHGQRVLEHIRICKPDIVLIGMGSPKQELWAQRIGEQTETPVMWTVGALFDFVSGRVRRAPHWMSNHGWEWLFRLALEPRRMWRRYLLGNPAFVFRVLRNAEQLKADQLPNS